MEGRMTVCNMSIEMGARGGLISPDIKTFEFVEGKKYSPKGDDYKKAVEKWSKLYTDADAKFDREVDFDAADIEPMITFGTNPGMGVKITGKIPELSSIVGSEQPSFQKSMNYMGFQAGDTMIGKQVDYVFIGSCTNGRIEDLRVVADYVKGKQKAANVTAWIVPGSKEVERQAIPEGIVDVLETAGFKMRQPGCSACLAMNDDKIPAGKYAVSTSNRNFEGRQGPGARTMLASPLTAAAVAVAGKVVDPRTVLETA